MSLEKTLLLGFIAPPFGLWDGRDGTGRPARGNAGLRTVLRLCVHGATFAHAAEEALKPR